MYYASMVSQLYFGKMNRHFVDIEQKDNTKKILKNQSRMFAIE